MVHSGFMNRVRIMLPVPPQRPPSLVPLLALSSGKRRPAQGAITTIHGIGPVSVPKRPPGIVTSTSESDGPTVPDLQPPDAMKHRGTDSKSVELELKSVFEPTPLPTTRTTKSPMYRQFVSELSSNAVRAPGRGIGGSTPPVVVPQSVQHQVPPSLEVSIAGTGSFTRSRPESAATTRSHSLSVRSRAITRPDISATQLHRHMPLLYMDGYKIGNFIKVRAQYDATTVPQLPLKSGRTSAVSTTARSSASSTRTIEAVTLVEEALRLLFDIYRRSMSDQSKIGGKIPTFAARDAAVSSLYLSDCVLLLRDFGIVPGVMSPTEVKRVYQQCCGTGPLSQELFPQFIIRVALFIDPAVYPKVNIGDIPKPNDGSSSGSHEQAGLSLGLDMTRISGLARTISLQSFASSMVTKESNTTSSTATSTAQYRIHCFVKTFGLKDLNLIRHFISSLASNHERQITVIPVALRGTIEEPRRAMPLAEMVLKKAHPTEVFKPLRCPRRSVAELEHQLKGVEAQYSDDLVTVLLGKQKAGGKRPTSATASRLTLPRWQNYDDVFLHMGGLKAGFRYDYRLVVTNATNEPVQIRALPVGLPEFVTVTCSCAAFSPGLHSMVHVTCYAPVGTVLECNGFVDIIACATGLPADAEMIRCPVYIQIS